MRTQVPRIRLNLYTKVRLLLTAVMGLVLALMLLLNSQQAVAQSYDQQPYGLSRDEVVARLKGSYEEAPVAGGIAANGNILEVFAAPEGRSWTIIVTRPDGTSSVLAEGEGWSFITVIEGLRV